MRRFCNSDLQPVCVTFISVKSVQDDLGNDRDIVVFYFCRVVLSTCLFLLSSRYKINQPFFLVIVYKPSVMATISPKY